MSFEVAAEAYDQFMGQWSRLLAPQLADFAAVRTGLTVLDVGCGPGALTSELVDRLGPSAVAAVDPSEPFVTAARQRHPGVDIRHAAAEQLPFPDATFDVSLAQLVVHFMADPVSGIAEMARVTRSTVAACVWDYAGGHGPLGPFWSAAQALDSGVEDESLLAGAREGHLEDLFRQAGLRNVDHATLSVSRHYSDFQEWWDPFTMGVGPAGAHVATLGADQRAALRERCRIMLPPGPFTLTARAWAARGESAARSRPR